MITESQESSVSIASGYRLNGWGSIPGRGKIFLFSKESRLALWPAQLLGQWVRETVSLGIKRQGREADHPLPSSDEVKNGGAIVSICHTS